MGTGKATRPGATELRTAAHGLLLTASFAHVWPHYLIVAYPLTGLWLARMSLGRPRGRALLGAVVVAHALLAASFLLRIHRDGGSPGGDYGVAYRVQRARAQSLESR